MNIFFNHFDKVGKVKVTSFDKLKPPCLNSKRFMFGCDFLHFEPHPLELIIPWKINGWNTNMEVDGT